MNFPNHSRVHVMIDVQLYPDTSFFLSLSSGYIQAYAGYHRGFVRSQVEGGVGYVLRSYHSTERMRHVRYVFPQFGVEQHGCLR